MARLTVTVTLTVIFSLFILSHARLPSTQPSNLVTEYPDTKPTESESESESHHVVSSQDSSDQTIRLPSDSESSEPDPDSINPEDSIRAIGLTRPLTITYDIGIHPIDRHVHHLHMKHPFWTRFPHRCRHHGDMQSQSQTQMQMRTPRDYPRELPYMNDAIMSNARAFDRVVRSQYFARQFGKHMMPRLPMLEREEVEEEKGEVEEEKGVDQQQPSDHHVMFRTGGHVEGEMEFENHQVERKEVEEGGFMRKVRKFLEHF